MPPATRQARQADRPADPSGQAWREVIWMGLRLEVPQDWEIVRHSIHLPRGRLVFIDRRRQRLQLSWAQVAGRPDLRQVFEDYRGLDRENDPTCRFDELADIAPWQGCARRGQAEPLTRLGRYFARRSLWVEMAVSWPAGRDPRVERGLVEGFGLTEPPCPPTLQAGQERDLGPSRWRAFGLDVTAPPGWALTRVEPKPADVTFRFRAAWDAPQEAAVRRMGLLEAWYGGDARAFLQKEVGYATECTFRDEAYGGLPACLAESAEPAPRLRKLTGRGRTRRDLVWQSQAAHALLCVTTWSRAKTAVDPRAFRAGGYLMR